MTVTQNDGLSGRSRAGIEDQIRLGVVNLKTPFTSKTWVAKSLDVEHSCNPVRAPEISGQSGSIMPEIGAITPEVDNGIVSAHSAMTMQVFCSIHRSNNTSGFPGVYLAVKTRRSKGGLNTLVYWQAKFPLENGKYLVKNFSVKTYGNDEARQRAIDARLHGLDALNNVLFRAKHQPVPASTEADRVMLAENEMMRKERAVKRNHARILEAARKVSKREEEKLQLETKLVRAIDAERQAILKNANRSGEPYISRAVTAKGTGHWRISIVRQGTRYNKVPSDSTFGDSAHALAAAARVWRDHIFAEVPPLTKAAVAMAVLSPAGGFPSSSTAKRKRTRWRSRPGQLLSRNSRGCHISIIAPGASLRRRLLTRRRMVLPRSELLANRVKRPLWREPAEACAARCPDSR